MTEHRETRQRLIGKIKLAFLSELNNANVDDLYDKEFISRIGLRSSQLGRSVVKMFVVMIVIDTLILLLMAGKGGNIQILGNKLSVLPGSIDIGLILSSFMYLLHIVYFVEMSCNDEIIRAYIINRYPKYNPIFFSGSFSMPNYTFYTLFSQYDNFIKNNSSYNVAKWTLKNILRILLSSMFVFHYYCIYSGINYVHGADLFGPLTTTLIASALYIINFSGMLLVSMVYMRLTFRIKVATGS